MSEPATSCGVATQTTQNELSEPPAADAGWLIAEPSPTVSRKSVPLALPVPSCIGECRQFSTGRASGTRRIRCFPFLNKLPTLHESKLRIEHFQNWCSWFTSTKRQRVNQFHAEFTRWCFVLVWRCPEDESGSCSKVVGSSVDGWGVGCFAAAGGFLSFAGLTLCFGRQTVDAVCQLPIRDLRSQVCEQLVNSDVLKHLVGMS